MDTAASARLSHYPREIFMRVIVNGDEVELPADATLNDLLQILSLGAAKVAVELNQTIVPRSQHALQRLQPDDCVEIVYAIGGG